MSLEPAVLCRGYFLWHLGNFIPTVLFFFFFSCEVIASRLGADQLQLLSKFYRLSSFYSIKINF